MSHGYDVGKLGITPLLDKELSGELSDERACALYEITFVPEQCRPTAGVGHAKAYEIVFRVAGWYAPVGSNHFIAAASSL